MTVKQAWKSFFADDASFNLHQALEKSGDKVEQIGLWSKPDDGSSLFERIISKRTKVPKNPFVDYANAKSHQYLRKLTGSEMVIDEVTSGSGFLYADSLRVHTRWEIISKFSDSTKSIMRHSWHLEWVNKPYFVSKIIFNTAKGKVESNMEYLNESFFPESIRKF